MQVNLTHIVLRARLRNAQLWWRKQRPLKVRAPRSTKVDLSRDGGIYGNCERKHFTLSNDTIIFCKAELRFWMLPGKYISSFLCISRSVNVGYPAAGCILQVTWSELVFSQKRLHDYRLSNFRLFRRTFWTPLIPLNCWNRFQISIEDFPYRSPLF